MAKSREQKKQIVEELIEKLSQMKSLVFLQFEGLRVKDIEEFRKRCREAGIEYTIVKKTLLDLAMKGAGLDVSPKEIEGNFGAVIGLNDEMASIKTAYDYSKKYESAKIAGGILWRKVVSSAMILQLAQLPTKEVLLAKIVGSISAPINGFVNVMAGNLRGLAQVINSIKNNHR